jgi:endonuclease-3
MQLKEVAEFLLQKYPWNKCDFATRDLDEHHCRYLYSCIIVAGDAEDRVFAALPALFTRFPGTYELSIAKRGDVADILEQHGIGYAGRKAQFIIETAALLRIQHNGRVPDERSKLEALPGVGRHIASVLLATLYGQEWFAVDHHVRRIWKRMGFPKLTDLKIEEFVANEVEGKDWGHLSRAFVDFGQDICGYTPRCSLCPFQDCPSRNHDSKAKEGLARTDMEVEIFRSSTDPTKFYSVTIRGGRLRCTCPGWKSHFNCKHTKEIKLRLETSDDHSNLVSA